MANDLILSEFLRTADAWICASYSIDIRYCAQSGPTGEEIWDATVTFIPVQHLHNNTTRFESCGFVLGQHQAAELPRDYLLALLRNAAVGRVEIPGHSTVVLPKSGEHHDCYSEMVIQDRWASTLHLQVFGPTRPTPAAFELASLANALRTAEPPFDGLADITSWLGLKAPGTGPSLTLRVLPPVDLIASTLTAGQLSLTIRSHPNFDIDKLGLALRGAPDKGLANRRQVAGDVRWSDVVDGFRTGTATIQMTDCFNVLVVLMVAGAPVRRHWVMDAARAENLRLVAMQHFDADLRKTKQALFEATDSKIVEAGLAAALYLMGFNAAVQLEPDAPDLVVTTPQGRLALVECTIRISDFHSKMGKLVDRRSSLVKSLANGETPFEVHAVLVCRLPRDQLAAQEQEICAHNIILVTREDLDAAMVRVRYVNDPDAILTAAAAQPGARLISLDNQG